jgi:hypothetical protein
MFLLLWGALVAVILAAADWVSRSVAGRPFFSPGRFDWRRTAIGLGTLLLIGGLGWWLFDVPGELRLASLVHAGNFAAAELPANQPHPLIAFDGWAVLTTILAALVAMSVLMIFRPSFWTQSAAANGDERSERALVGRVRIYGIVILIILVVGVVVLGVQAIHPFY